MVAVTSAPDDFESMTLQVVHWDMERCGVFKKMFDGIGLFELARNGLLYEGLVISIRRKRTNIQCINEFLKVK